MNYRLELEFMHENIVYREVFSKMLRKITSQN